jgi:hypothetical protein
VGPFQFATVPYTFPFPLHEYPVIPDLVPPGHAGSHYAHPSTDVHEAMEYITSAADVVINCGFSAREPDLPEAQTYFVKMQQEAVKIHVGFELEEASHNVANMMRASDNYRFVPIGEVNSLLGMLNVKFFS